MTQTEIEEIIKQRIELCDTEVTPIFEMTEEELSEVTLTPRKFKDYIQAIGQKTLELDCNLTERILGEHSYYVGQLEGMQKALKLFELVKAPKVPFICDDGDTEYEDYKCGYCGHRIYKDDKFCSECGVSLQFNDN